MLKVCSYPRSGTHLLMATLAKHFDFGEDLALYAHAGGNKWCDGKRDRLDVPWGKLFGSNLPLDRTGLDPKEVLYIVRHPIEVMRSNWEFNGKIGSLAEYVTDERLRYWRNHVEGYTQCCRFVTYEDLSTRPIATMDQIKTWFGLTRNGVPYEAITERVGWLPKAKQGPRDGYSVPALMRFKDIIGNKYMGYRI